MTRNLPLGACRCPEMSDGLFERNGSFSFVNSSTAPGNRRLIHRRLVEVLDRLHLRLGELALEPRVGLLDFGDERGNLVVLRSSVGGDLFALAIEAADETDLLQQLVRRIGDEVVDAVFLTDLGCDHCFSSRERRLWCRILRILASLRGGLRPLPPRRGSHAGPAINWAIRRENAPGPSRRPGLVSHIS
jgi:hypothetical protein